MKIFPLSEGSFTVDKTKLFVPFEEGQDQLQERPRGSLLVEIQPFLVILQNDILLFDTGLGFADPSGQMQIHKNLAEKGVAAADITKVLLTHLHKDHAGGIALQPDHRQPAFPNATYYLQKRELDFAFERGIPSFIPEEFHVLKNMPNLVLLQNDEGSIDDHIRYEVTGAHSPFHQVFWVSDGDETVFFGGDDAPQLQQMKHRFTAKYDHDGRKAMLLRQQWWKEGEEKKWSFLFYHDIQNPIWKF